MLLCCPVAVHGILPGLVGWFPFFVQLQKRNTPLPLLFALLCQIGQIGHGLFFCLKAGLAGGDLTPLSILSDVVSQGPDGYPCPVIPLVDASSAVSPAFCFLLGSLSGSTVWAEFRPLRKSSVAFPALIHKFLLRFQPSRNQMPGGLFLFIVCTWCMFVYSESNKLQ